MNIVILSEQLSKKERKLTRARCLNIQGEHVPSQTAYSQTVHSILTPYYLFLYSVSVTNSVSFFDETGFNPNI